MARCRARIVAIARPAPGIHRIDFQLDGDFAFAAGQYLNVCVPRGRLIPFSIASAPERLPHLSIHFRPVPGAADAEAMLELLSTGASVELEGPRGDVMVSAPTDGPLCLMAGGTGVSQCRGIVEHLGFGAQTETVRLLWSVSASDQLYDVPFFDSFGAQHAWFSFETAIDTPGGPTGAAAWIERYGVPPEPLVILAGSPGFVYAACDAITARGGDAARLRSDVFTYAPRH